MTQDGFKGDVSPRQAWTALIDNGDAVLIDVRSAAEWAFVGAPDLSGLARPVLRVEWQTFPGMARNAAFSAQVLAADIGAQQPLYLICRSGVRSRAAALELAAQGYTSYNVADGFEGQLGPDGHRGVGGWRALGLPWRQT